MKTIIIFILLLLASSIAFGQKAEKEAYKIRAKGSRLIVTYKSKSHTLDATGQIDAAKVTGAEILFAGSKGEFTYLVVDASGWSREKQNDRQCGAGTEANLIWIKLDAKWRIAGINSQRYESCWASTTSTDGYRIEGDKLTIEIDNFRDDKNIKLIYNADEAEKGFQITEKPLDNN